MLTAVVADRAERIETQRVLPRLLLAPERRLQNQAVDGGYRGLDEQKEAQSATLARHPAAPRLLQSWRCMPNNDDDQREEADQLNHQEREADADNGTGLRQADMH